MSGKKKPKKLIFVVVTLSKAATLFFSNPNSHPRSNKLTFENEFIPSNPDLSGHCCHYMQFFHVHFNLS
jgi:hypothetical protein